MTFPLFVALLLLFAAWFTLSVAAVLFLYAIALHTDERRRKAMLDRSAVAAEFFDVDDLDLWVELEASK